ncbi:UNVERIFIED_CONTAM: hypothetical protein K2H54_020714 [Gekko kuhli]
MNRFAVLAEQTDLSVDSDASALFSALLDENTGNKVDNGSPSEQLKETAADSTELILTAMKHLKALFGDQVRVVDIKELEVLDNVNQVQRILLSCKTVEIPSLILQNKDYLKTSGIFPARVFTNTRVMPLLPNLNGAEEGKGHKLEKRADKSTKDDESNINGGVQESNGGTVGVNTQATSLEMLLESRDVEENIQESFITLPEQEQQWIINRLELLKLNLTKCRAEKRIVPIAPQLESLAETHNLAPKPQAQLCRTEEVMEIQITCPEDEEPRQVEEQGTNRECELVAKQTRKLNRNGSICPESNKSLEKIIELD